MRTNYFKPSPIPYAQCPYCKSAHPAYMECDCNAAAITKLVTPIEQPCEHTFTEVLSATASGVGNLTRCTKCGACHYLDTPAHGLEPKTGDKRSAVITYEGLNMTAVTDFIFVDRVGWVAVRNVEKGINYNKLEQKGYVSGREIVVAGEKYICRILTTTEWDDCVNWNDLNDVWHWKDVFSWVYSAEIDHAKSIYHVLRGYSSARNFDSYYASVSYDTVGFRPVLIPLNAGWLQSKVSENWIDVKNKLPEDGAKVIVYIGDIGIQLTTTYSKKLGFFYPRVTHWMPQPSPPTISEVQNAN